MNASSGVTSLGLSTTRAAGGERRSDLVDDLVQRVVPRRDGSRRRRPARARRASCRPSPRTGTRRGSARSRRSCPTGRPAWIMLANMIGMPISSEMTWAISSLRAARPSAMAWMYLPRSSLEVWPQVSKAVLAAATAWSTSAAVPAGIRGDDLFGRGVLDVDGVGAGGRHPRAVDVELAVVGHEIPLRRYG